MSPDSNADHGAGGSAPGWLLVRGDAQVRLQVRRGQDGKTFESLLETSGVAGHRQSVTFSDEAEAQTHLQSELTRLVGEGWRRERPELGSEHA